MALALTWIEFPIITSDKLLIAVFGGFFLGVGIGLSIRGGSVIDGTEVLAIYSSRKTTLTVGDFIMIFNLLIFSVAAYLIDIETALYAILTYLVASKTVDFVVHGIEEYTSVMIVSQKSEEIKDAKSMKTLEVELHDKMLSLQFVTPAHLEIQCLKSKSTSDTVDSHESIDLSYTIQQIQSIHGLSSPRQMLQSILLAHRGVSVALNEACGQETTGADDVLPTLILATLRAHPPHLLSSLRFIEDFAPMSLLRGEAGYAYTNLCGVMQFIRELDMDGHLAEVISLEGTGEKSAVLSIGPEEFRLGLEMCRRKMKAKMEEKEQLKLGSVEECMNNDYHGGYDANNEQCINGTSFQINITAHDVRDARTRGETIDLDWAMRKQSKSALLQRNATDASSDTIKYNQQLNLPPEEPPLPSHFSRSYSYLTSNPDSIGIRDLPKLLKEYKMLVHVTEKLLNERSVWRESERKRQTKLERQQLEKDFLDVGIDEDGNSPKLANGH